MGRNESIVFTEIIGVKRSVEIARQLIQAIRAGIYRPGDRLPPEDEIARLTGTSRPSVREALGALKVAGIVEAKAGSGTYVRKLITSAEIENHVFNLLTKKEPSLFEVLEARQVVETGIAEAAIDNLTSDELRQIGRYIKDMDQAIKTRDWGLYRNTNRAFHLAIITLARNSVIKSIVEQLIDVGKTELWRKLSIWSGGPSLQKVTQSYNEHLNIFLALEKRDPKALKKQMAAHFVGISNRLMEGG